MLSTHIDTIAGLPVSFTQPVVVARSCHITGHTQKFYKIHTNTTASWELQIGDFVQKMSIHHTTNGCNGNPFASVADIVGYEPIVHLGNSLRSNDDWFIDALSKETDNDSGVFHIHLKHYGKSFSRDIGVKATSDDVARLAVVLATAYKYVRDCLVKTDFSGLQVFCAADYTASEDYIIKAVEALEDYDIIWDVESPDDIKPANRKPYRYNTAIRDAILNEGFPVVTKAFMSANYAVAKAAAAVAEVERQIADNEALIEKNKTEGAGSVDFFKEYGDKFRADLLVAQEKLDMVTAHSQTIALRLNNYKKEMKITDTL